MYMSLINKYLNFWMVCTSKQWSYALGFTSRYRNLKILIKYGIQKRDSLKSSHLRSPNKFCLGVDVRDNLENFWINYDLFDPKKTRRSADRSPLLIDWLLINWWSHQTRLLMFLFPLVAPNTPISFPRALCRQLLVRFEYKVENYSFFALRLLYQLFPLRKYSGEIFS